MELGLQSRKRKQRSSESSPFAGIFTRSRSQIYVHHHRSGYARADSIRSRNLDKSLERKTKLLVQLESGEGMVDRLSNQVPVKDLRARRVFSPGLSADESVSVGSGDLKGEVKVEKVDEQNPNFSSAEDEAADGDLGVPVADGLNPSLENSSSVRENHVVEADEFVQMTPTALDPDENKGVVGENGVILAGNDVADTKVSVTRSQSSTNVLRGRRKVFKSPSSFSYRRLLPYLMDIGKDDTDASKFEIVETAMPGKVQKSNNVPPNMVPSKDEEVGAESDGRKLEDKEILDNVESGKMQCSNRMNPNVEQKSHEDVVSDTMEECEQMTPPDAEIYSKPRVDESLDVLGKPSHATIVKHDDVTAKNVSRESNDAVSVSKLVLSPCSRRVLQYPSSFSHRRLLPYLMNTAGDDTRASKIDQCLKHEKHIEQNLQPPSFSVLHQNIHVAEAKTNSDYGNLITGQEKSDSPMPTLIPTDASPEEITAITLASSENAPGAHGLDTVCDGSTSQLEVKPQAEAEAVQLDSSTKLENESPEKKLKCVQEVNLPVSLCSTTRPETLPIICTKQESGLCQLDSTNELSGLMHSSIKNKIKRDHVSIHQSSSQIVPFDSSGIYGENLRKGILKRNPRGCRGICNCLNCMSFRLHAERAFEFSKNQMHDAEEVALELINDLTCLRNILEKTAADPNYLATVPEKQVKEACAKALHTEGLARTRLVQMNEDLSFHCRSTNLLRPNVTFANKIEEKVISKSCWPK